MADYSVTDRSEEAVRELVAGIARRGSRAYTAANASAAGGQAAAEAAQAAIAADPVELPPAAADGVRAAAERSAALAEAQRAIFAEGRERETQGFNEWAEDHGILTEAMGADLQRYAAEWAESQRRGGGGGGRRGPSIDLGEMYAGLDDLVESRQITAGDPYAFTPPTARADHAQWRVSAFSYFDNRDETAFSDPFYHEGNFPIFEAIYPVFEDGYFSGLTLQDTEAQARELLLNAGVSAVDTERAIGILRRNWQAQFDAADSRPDAAVRRTVRPDSSPPPPQTGHGSRGTNYTTPAPGPAGPGPG